MTQKTKAAKTAAKKPAPAKASKPAAPVIRTVDLAELKSDPRNARRHNERNKAVIAKSLRDFGAGRSLVADADGVIRAGNGTLEQAAAVGIKQAIVVETDGSQIVVVQRKDLDGDRATAYALADNRAAELAEWDPEVLAAQVEELAAGGIDVDGLAMSDFDLEELLRDVPGDDAAGSENEQEESPGEPRAVRGHEEQESPDQTSDLIPKFLITVSCENEQQHRELLDRLQRDGFKCKALIS